MTDLTDLILDEGRIREYEVVPAMEQLSYRFGDFRILEKKPGVLRIENKGDRKLALSGQVELTIEIPCARCLKPVSYRLNIRPELDIDLNDSVYMDGCGLDVDQLIHDEALLVWPERVLCRSDCKGLCMTCGKDLNFGQCSCAKADLDPRMAKVLDIFRNYKEV